MRTRVQRPVMKLSMVGGAALLVLWVAALVPPLHAQTNGQGQWKTLPYDMPINPVHLALTNNGKVLIVAGSGNVAAETNFRAAVWDPQAETIVTQTVGWDMFCNGLAILPDGRVLINGGNLQYDPFHGHLKNAAFDPVTGLFTDLQNMAHGRWYPTVTILGDGRAMAFSGLNETGATNTAVELYTVGSGWSPEYPAGWTPPLYPRMHLLPDGTVLYSGSGTGSRIFNPVTKGWSAVVATTNYTGTRTYGTSVLLPLSPADGYKARVMIFGGGNPATASTEILDTSAAPLQWRYGPSMSQPRIEMNATILPNGKVLAVGGSKNDEDASTASLNADLYDPETNTFSSAGANVYPRLYHSGSLLLPDATVLLAGGNPARGTYETHMEIYSPAYLFNADGTPAIRPVISGVSPDGLNHGKVFQVQTSDAADITSVVLVRPGAQTHAFDMDQRLVRMSFTIGAGVLNVTAPPNGNIAPPGYYMLFILNSAGVPSTATFLKLSAAPPNQAPVATITDPATDITVNPGQSVSFAGTGVDADGTVTAYSWSFPGGSPASSTAASPGAVTYGTPGSFVASFTVTDDGGSASAAATRTISVPDFSVSSTPSSGTVAPGAATTYTATITAGAGFTGTVDLGVSGLPAGASGPFSPSSLTGGGSSTLTVTTAPGTAAGTYPLTITATSGSVVHTASATLVVTQTGDFSITVAPVSRTIAGGGSTTYTVTIAPAGGFQGTVNLAVLGLPKFVTATFSPASVAQGGTSVLTVATKKQTRSGSATLTITGTAGGLAHSVTCALVVQ